MEIRNLVTFQKIYELGSFSAAATALGYSQSTITMQIKQLELELGVQLFDRIGRKISITNEGLRFSKYAAHIISTSKNALEDLSSNAEPKGELKIGILESICTAHLPIMLNKYHQSYPKVTTIVKIGTFVDLSYLLNSGQIDILWIYDNKIDIPEWTNAFTYESQISIVCCKEHPFINNSNLSLSDIALEPFILSEKDCSYRSDFINSLSSLGYTPNVFLEIGNTEIIKKFVEANLGLAVLPNYTISNENETPSLATLAIDDFHLVMYGQLFHHRNKWISPALQVFIDLVANSAL